MMTHALWQHFYFHFSIIIEIEGHSLKIESESTQPWSAAVHSLQSNAYHSYIKYKCGITWDTRLRTSTVS